MSGRSTSPRRPSSCGRGGGSRPQRDATGASGFSPDLGDETSMKGIILAAGKGSRLNGTIGDKPKCLLRVGGKTLVERQIDAFRRVGIDDIVMVVGCQAEAVRRTCGERITYIENTRFAQTNSLYSLWLARPLLYNGFVVMNCDVLLHPQLLDDLLTSRHEDALLVAYQDDDQSPLGEEEMKVRTRRGRVVDISKA